jgi:uncharacterized membrane protein (UPF0127 family)
MDRTRAWALVVVVVLVAVGVTVAVDVGLAPFPEEDTHDRATVTIRDPDGSVATVVDARVADTTSERWEGLSGTDSLANGSGVLFVHDREEDHTYVMRRMNYGLDIVFLDADRTVTAVRSLPPPGPGEDGSDIQATGRARWVLEVPRGFANATGIDPGDRVTIEYRD